METYIRKRCNSISFCALPAQESFPVRNTWNITIRRSPSRSISLLTVPAGTRVNQGSFWFLPNNLRYVHCCIAANGSPTSRNNITLILGNIHRKPDNIMSCQRIREAFTDALISVSQRNAQKEQYSVQCISESFSTSSFEHLY